MPPPERPIDCPSVDELIAYHRGDVLPPEAAASLLAHLEGCPRCEASLVALDSQEGTVAAGLRQAGVSQPAAAFAPGTVIAGRYTLVAVLGEGGMGTVWRADQTAPVRRPVAIKLIKAGMDSRAVLARFAAERQALAVMDHPNIARVLDAGATEGGSPYFAMELVEGVPITEYCDARRLTPRERLALFVPVCQAVQHAHQKGVIHRDLKPSNVLVGEVDGRPVAKVIDFGIAKATGAALTDLTLNTGLGAVVGTPEYMAPEQADLAAADIDTRADVYALGVVLYELLTGSTPLTRLRAARVALLEVLRLVREEEPPLPSGRLSTADALPSLAANRGTEPRRLTALLRGELDWVVMKCLEKDRGRRYETASGLARDLERYLADEPVEAGRPTAWYRLRKSARRHRVPVFVAAALVATLAAGTVGTTLGLVRAEAARDAEARQRREAVAGRQAAEASRELAVAKVAEANAVVTFFEEKVFAAGRPRGYAGGLGKDVTLRDAVVASLPALTSGFAAQPLIEARLRNAVGGVFTTLGEPRAAADQYERSLAIHAARSGPTHEDTLTSMHLLAVEYSLLGRSAEALDLREKVCAVPGRSDPPNEALRFTDLTSLAASYEDFGRHADALRLRETVLAGRRLALAPDHPDTLRVQLAVGGSHFALGQIVAAQGQIESATASARRTLPADSPVVLEGAYALGAIYARLGRHAEAIALKEEAVAGRRRVFPPDHPYTIKCVRNLSNSYNDVGRHPDALRLKQEVLASCQRVYPAGHKETLESMNDLADSYLQAGRHPEALLLVRPAYEAARAKFGPAEPIAMFCGCTLAEVLHAAGKSAEAVPVIDECVRHGTSRGLHPMLLPTLLALRLKHFRDANDAAGCRATAALWEGLSRDDPASLTAAARMRAVAAGLYAKAGQTAEATADADRAMAWLTKAVAARTTSRNPLDADADLDALRGRPDFRQLLGSLRETAPPPRALK